LPSQLVLPLSVRPSYGRTDFVVAPSNAQAVAFLDTWPHWPVNAAAIHGPAGSGKTHLVSIWRAASGAQVVSAAGLGHDLQASGPVVIEDVDAAAATETRDAVLFRLLLGATIAAPVLLTGKEPPSDWFTTLPDLASRFSALLSLPVWAPDDALLAALARKLLADRQLSVPAPVIDHMVRSLERSPESIRAFIARADAKALSEARPVSLSLVRELISDEGSGLS